MSSKILTGSYAAGYNVHQPVTIVTLAAGGYVGGAGLSTSSGATAAYTVVNLGKINGSNAYAAAGIYLADGGRVTNGSATHTSASVAGAYRGVSIRRAVGTVTNFGTITASEHSGVLLGKGGRVTNGSLTDTGALISTAGTSNGVSSSAAATINNFGTVAGYTGVALYEGGQVTNGAASDKSALIRGANTGVVMSSVAGATETLSNFGTIAGGDGGYASGVDMRMLGAHSRITNGSAVDAAALITGAVGVYISGASETVVNFATIQGTNGVAVYCAGANDTLLLEKGSMLLGGISSPAPVAIDVVDGTATVKGDLVNAGAIAGVGTLSVIGAISLFAPGSTISKAHVALGGVAELSGALTVKNGGALSARRLTVGQSDTLTVTGANSNLTLSNGATIGANGVIAAAAGGLVQIGGSVANKGTLQINGGTLQASGTTLGAVAFTGATGTLELGTAGILTAYATVTYAGSVSGLSTAGSSSLDLFQVRYLGAATMVTYVDNGKHTGGVLTVTGETAGQGQTDVITLVGDYSKATWTTSDDGAGGTKVMASQSAPAAAHKPQAFASAMAAISPPPFQAGAATAGRVAETPWLAAPRSHPIQVL